jgi:hypothetical protein
MQQCKEQLSFLYDKTLILETSWSPCLDQNMNDVY